jgi:hypothetical protein
MQYSWRRTKTAKYPKDYLFKAWEVATAHEVHDMLGYQIELFGNL